MRQIKINYKAELPLLGSSPVIQIIEDEIKEYQINLIDNITNILIDSVFLKSNEIYKGNRQWYTEWRIDVLEQRKLIHQEILSLFNKSVFIKIDARALGDNLAWMSYVEEFRKKHNCRLICSTFFNELFQSEYPEILFVIPNTKIENVYAQYYVGTSDKLNLSYSPSCYLDNPLQKVACDILGLEYKQINSKVLIPKTERTIKEKYVCISEFASLKIKQWNYEGGWQEIVDHLNNLNYKVVVISKEKTELKNIIDKSGDISLLDRINDLNHCEFFMGVSSGLSWLANSVNKPVVLISNFTPKNHEFSCIRVYDENVRQKIVYEELNSHISPDKVKRLLW